MGNQPQKNTQGSMPAKVNHPKFPMATITHHGQQSRLTTTMGVDQKEYEKWKHQLQTIRPNPEYLLLPVSHDFKRKGLCGNSGSLTLSYPNYSYLLSEQIYNRRGRSSRFEEAELWYLLLILAGAQNEMKKRTKGKVGDIRPHNTFLNSEGQARVSCLLSWPRESTNFSKTFDNEPTYLAPEDMERLEMGTLEDTINYRSQIFSIGLTVLSAGMLEDFLRLYNTNNYRFDAKEAEILLDEWRSNTVYSQVFTALISNLCQFRLQRRLDENQLWAWLSKFQSEIKDKKDFFIEQVPSKLEQEIQEISQRYPVDEQPQQEIHQTPQVYHEEVKPHLAYNGLPPDRSAVETYSIPHNVYQPEQPPRRLTTQTIQGHQTFQNQYQDPRQGSIRNRGFQPLSPQRANPVQIRSPRSLSKQPEYIHHPQHGNPSLYAMQRPPGIPGDFPQVNNGFRQHETREFKQGTPPQIKGSSTESQLPPQLVGRTVSVSRGGQVETVHHGYVPSQSQEGEPTSSSKGSNNLIQRPASLSGGQNQNYFQKVIDPQAANQGRFEETVYVPRSNYHRLQ